MTELRHPLNSLPRCPQCGTARPTLDLEAVLYRDLYGGTPADAWLIYQCTSCKNPVCFLSAVPVADVSQVRSLLWNGRYLAREMLPSGNEDFADWPDRARRYMLQAVEALGTPDGAVMLAGSAVDAMLKEKGLASGTVYRRIENAVADKLLTEAMGEWAHAVRLSANNPRHADLDEPHASLEEAKASIDFARALGQFLFVLPARIERGKEAAELASEDAKGGAE